MFLSSTFFILLKKQNENLYDKLNVAFEIELDQKWTRLLNLVLEFIILKIKSLKTIKEY